jgi:hypothetical protein
MTKQYRLCAKCTGYHAKTQLLPETCPSRGSYLLGTSLATSPNWESIDIKNRAPRNLPKPRKFMHMTSRQTPPSPPRHFFSAHNHAAVDRQTSSQHGHSVRAWPQLLSAGNIYPSRKAYGTFVHSRQNAPKSTQLSPIDSHSVPTFGIASARVEATFCKRNHRNRFTRSNVIPFLVHFSTPSRTLFRSFCGHSFPHTDKTTMFSTTKRCTHLTITPMHPFQLVETGFVSYNQTYSTFSHENIETYCENIQYDTSTPAPDRIWLHGNPSCILQHLLHLSGPDFCAQKPTHHALTTPFHQIPLPPRLSTPTPKPHQLHHTSANSTVLDDILHGEHDLATRKQNFPLEPLQNAQNMKLGFENPSFRATFRHANTT